jgi:hypothetical protein
VLLRSRSPLAEAVQEVASVLHVVVGASVTEAAEVDFREAVLEAVAPSAEEVAVEADSAIVAAEVDRASRAAVLALAEEEAAEVVAEATKCLASHLDTPKSAKHEGVNRQRRHGVMRGLGRAWEMVRKWRHCFVTLYRTILRYKTKRSKKTVTFLPVVDTSSMSMSLCSVM